jgi:TRAP-type C4-dicarboxylate transport system permease small subunit
MLPFSRLIEKLAWATVLVGGIGLLLSMGLGVADVVGTYLGHPVPGAYELTESSMVLVVFGGLTYAQIKRKHIRVELIYLRMGPRAQSTMDIFADISALIFFGLMAWQGWNEAIYSININEATSGLIRFPLYPARILLVVGVCLFLVQMTLDLIDDTHRLITGAGGRKDDLISDEIRALMEEGAQHRA